MADVILHGFPQSTYMRTVRLAAEEKGIPYSIAEIEFGSDAHRALHPFVKMPAMTHGDLHLFESFAITRYFDESFDGPPLQPRDAAQRAVMTQWVSAFVDYVYGTVVRGLIMPRLVYPQRGQPVDEAALKENLPNIDSQFSLLERQLSEQAFIAGPDVTLADFFYAPPIAYLQMIPEGAAALSKCPKLSVWQEAMAARESFRATQPQLAA